MVAFSFALLGFVGQSPVDLSADPALTRPVTYSGPAAPSKALLAAVSKSTGISLVASPSVASEILLVDVKGMPAAELMKRLARASAGSWTKLNGAYTLTRTEADEAKREEAAYQRTYTVVKKKLDELRKVATEALPFDDAAAHALISEVRKSRDGHKSSDSGPDQSQGISFEEVNKEQQATPAGRLATRVAALLKPEMLARCPFRRRMVYSTDANAMEVPLDLDLTSVVSQFVSEQNTWADSLTSLDEQERMRLFRPYDGNPASTSRISSVPAKVNVVVERFEQSGGNITVRIEVVDAHGGRLGSSEYEIPTGISSESMPNLKSDKAGIDVQLTPEEQAMVDGLKAMNGRQNSPVKPSQAARSFLSHPDMHEVLGGFPSRILSQTGHLLQKNIVADVPDAMVAMGAFALQTNKPTPESVLQLLQTLPGDVAHLEIDDQTIEIDGGRPLPTEFMAHRSDRAELTRLLNSSDSMPPIEALARYEVVGLGTQDDYLEMLLGLALFPGFSPFSGEASYDALYVAGALMQETSDVIPTGTVEFRALSPKVLSVLRDLVFYSSFRPPMSPGAQTADMCELFPQGLPPNGTLTVSLSNQSAVFAADGTNQVIEPSQIAWTQAVANHPDKFRTNHPMPVQTEFRVGTTRKLTIKIQLNHTVGEDLSYLENHLSDGNVMKFNELPADFRKKVQDSLDLYNRMLEH